jgi:predicted MFS family arabinose efflux permease
LAAALAIEALDELVDGTKGAAFPLIRADLHLSYTEVGLLIAVPLLVGGLVELPFGLAAGSGRSRNRLVLAGGLALASSLVVVAFARSFGVLLLGFVAFFPASGAFVSLTQAALMDAEPARHQQRMAAWNLAGSAGAVAGPLLLAGVLVADGTWRSAYLLLAGGALVITGVAAASGPAKVAGHGASEGRAHDDHVGQSRCSEGRAHDGHVGQNRCSEGRAHDGSVGRSRASNGSAHSGRVGDCEGEGGGSSLPAEACEDLGGDRRPTLRQALRAVRYPDVARWLILLQIADLLLDVLTGYIGIYLVDVARASATLAAIGVAIRLAAGLAGDAAWVVGAHRLSGLAALRASAVAACALYPALLLLPWLGAKLAVLAALSFATACWYPVAQAELYGSLSGRSGIAVFWSSAAGMIGAVGPLVVGLIAQRAGLGLALACLLVTPVGVLVLLPRRTRSRSLRVMR